MDANHEFANEANDAALGGPDLYPWDSGAAVAELQELLRAHGFDVRVDGDFGYMTEAAVKAYQKQHGLKIDGVVNAETWASLKTTVLRGSRVLRLGHTGADVRQLQVLLQIYGYNVPVDGVFDEKTKQAVIAFQQTHKLKDNGMVDSITWRVLQGTYALPTPPKQTRWFFNNRKWW